NSPDAATAGKPLYHLRCARCHGERGEGSGNIPPLRAHIIPQVTPGEIFWFITKGDVKNEMPSWAGLPAEQRWKIVTYLKALNGSSAAKASTPAPPPSRISKFDFPLPKSPFADFR